MGARIEISLIVQSKSQLNAVAPLVGARIEIRVLGAFMHKISVAPLVGARIEIVSSLLIALEASVAPLVGARIEISHIAQ